METIATFSKPEDAHLLRMHLESLGISAVIQDDNLPLHIGSAAGIRVQVADEDLEAARAALEADKGAE
jgi:Putative prokaryotic signal transducing protein